MQNASRAYNKKIANISGSIRLTSQKKLEISNLLIQGNIILEFGKLRKKITLKEHFRKLIAQPEDEFDVGMSSKYYSPNPILDQNFTEEEIKRAIRHLKNNKNCAIDEILNEYPINSTSE